MRSGSDAYKFKARFGCGALDGLEQWGVHLEFGNLVIS
jgi:hypothetical protein